jgi:cysteine-rich secretory family protein
MRRYVLPLVLLAACGSNGSSGGNGDGGSGDDGSSGSSAEQLCVDTINMYRATLSLPPYARWNGEESCASSQAQMDSSSGTAHGAFGMCGEFAQDECPGWPGPPSSMITSCLALMWAEGPGPFDQGHGHYDNMSSTSYTQVACGFYVLPDGSVWAAQDFK